ncbi:MAG: hypothetical protein IKK84_04410 [Clostridia bacterium]|nr:hypothetical protein [Clostridia bacterium]
MKKGIINICLMFFGIIIIFILTFTYILYFQVGTITKNIKEDLYYTLMNGILDLDKEELSYAKYSIDNFSLEKRLNKWAEETAKRELNVQNIEIEEIVTDMLSDRAKIKVNLKVTFIPLIKIREKLSFYLQDEIDLMLLEYN